jgi:hypothetical protein
MPATLCDENRQKEAHRRQAAKLARHPVVTIFKSGLFPEIMRRCWPQNEVSC